MANPPPAGRWIRLASMRPTAVPAPEPPPPQPPVPQIRPALGRTFTIGFRPSIPQLPQPQQTVVLPPPPPIVQPAPLPPQLPSVRDVSSPPPVPPIVSSSPPKTPPPPADTTAASPRRTPPPATATVPSPRRTPPPAAATVPSPRRTPPPAATTVASPRRTPPPASATPTQVSQSPRGALPAILPNAVLSPPKSPVAPTYSPPPRSPLAPTSSSPPPPLPRTPPGPAATAVPPQQTPPTAAFYEMGKTAPSPPEQPKLQTPPPRSPDPASAPTLVPSPPSQTYPVLKSASGSTTMGRISPNSSKPRSPRPATFLAPTTSSQPTSSVSKVVTFSSVTTVPNPVESPLPVPTANNRGTSPATSPKTTLKAPERTPPQSPMIRFSNAPPSPLHLPPPQLKSDEDYEPKIPLEAEKKTVPFQKIIDQPKPTVHNGVNSGQIDSRDTFKAMNSANHGRHEAAKGFETKEKGMHKKLTSFDELGVRILTIAGENKGAMMELGYSQRKQDHFPGHPHTLQSTQNYNSKSNGNASEKHSSDEGKSKKGKNQIKNAMFSPPMNAITNSNVQGINNSLLFNSSFTHHDPGVHLSLTRKPSNGHKFHLKDGANGHHS